MSAMHWEARRRQSALDRRTATNKQQLMQRLPETSCATETKTPQEQAGVGQSVDTCPHCQGDLKTSVHGGAKIPNRYSSLQYNQQW